MTTRPDRERCGYLIQYSAGLFAGQSGAYRVSKGELSNIIDERLFDPIEPACDDATFTAYMEVMLGPDFPHPFMVPPEPEPKLVIDTYMLSQLRELISDIIVSGYERLRAADETPRTFAERILRGTFDIREPDATATGPTEED